MALSLRSSQAEGSTYASVGTAALFSADETYQALSLKFSAIILQISSVIMLIYDALKRHLCFGRHCSVLLCP